MCIGYGLRRGMMRGGGRCPTFLEKNSEKLLGGCGQRRSVGVLRVGKQEGIGGRGRVILVVGCGRLSGEWSAFLFSGIP